MENTQQAKAETTETTEVKAITVGEDYAVTVVDKAQLQAFFTDGKNLDGLYSVIEKTARGLVADPTTKEGASQIKSAARQLASVKKRIDDIGKDVVAELKALPNVIDDNRKKFREDMEALQDEIRRPVTEIEEREDEIEGIKNTHVRLAGANSDQLKAEIDAIRAIPLTEEKWHESLEKAKAAIDGEAKALALLMDTALKREAEARELEELRKKQEEAERIIREQKIREEAERKAREEAEARAAANAERLKREKEEAERKAEEAEKARKEAEDRAKAHQHVPMSRTIQQLDAARPSRWTDEQKAVNKAILVRFAEAVKEELPKYLSGFTDNGYKMASEAIAKRLVGSIVKGEIVNLEVRY